MRLDQTADAHPDGTGTDTATAGPAGVPGEPGAPGSAVADDRLRLIFTCCHPALSLEARLALTLRSLGGLEVPELARAFLTTETAMYQRLVRAKRKIVTAGIPYRVPPDGELPERLAGVLRVVYLLFNEGHTATAGDELVRDQMCDEAIRLARLLAGLVPRDAEAQGLLALLLLTDARRGGRTAADPVDPADLEVAVALDAQDRSRWNRARIAEGHAVLDRALALGPPGPAEPADEQRAEPEAQPPP
jgi:RNA polymerase sigma-70 factor (ECF subfamily)